MNPQNKYKLVGQKFNKWSVIGDAESKRKRTRFLCKCECGTEKVVSSESLVSGKSKGCVHCAKKSKKHGLSQHPLYDKWYSIKERCNNEKCHAYRNYGGRGIQVCDEWNNFLDSFMTWAFSNGYEDGLEIDRTDNNGNYEPSNCRFVTRKENSCNRRTNRYVTIDGVKKTITDWCKDSGISYDKLSYRLKAGWPTEKLFIERKGKRKKATLTVG